MLNLTNRTLKEYEGYNPHLHIKEFINDDDYNTLLEQYPDITFCTLLVMGTATA